MKKNIFAKKIQHNHKSYIMKKIFILLTLLFIPTLFIFSQNRIVARGAEPGELYLTGAWYGIYNPIMPWYYDTLQTAIYRITENGKKLTIQYDADYFANPEIIMQPQHILADATAGVVYNKSNYSKNSYPYTSLWVSFDYGKNWIFREENIGSNGYYAANIEGLIYRAYYIFYESLDYGFTFSEVDYGPGGSEPGLQNGEGFSVWYTSNKLLRYSNDFGNTFIEFPIDEQFVFGQIWGRFPDVYRGGLSGEVYVSSMFPYNNQYNPDVKYKVSFSADTGHTFRHVYESEFLDPDKSFPIFMSDREPGVFYIVKSYQVEDFNPWGHHTKVCIEYYRDYGETLVGTYCHDVHKNYGKTCEAVNNLVSEKCGDNCVLLSWSEPESSLPVEEYWVYRNAESRRQKAESRMEEELAGITTGTTFLDENLSNGSYEYYVVVHYTNNCISDSSNHVVVNIEVGINERENVDKIIIYPNPTTGELRITNYELRIEGVEIYDIYGKMIEIPHCVRNDVIPSVAQRSEESRTINIAHLSKGIYFVKIATEKGIVTKKVIKY